MGAPGKEVRAIKVETRYARLGSRRFIFLAYVTETSLAVLSSRTPTVHAEAVPEEIPIFTS